MTHVTNILTGQDSVTRLYLTAGEAGKCSQVWTLEDEACMDLADLSGTNNQSRDPVRIKSPCTHLYFVFSHAL